DPGPGRVQEAVLSSLPPLYAQLPLVEGGEELGRCLISYLAFRAERQEDYLAFWDVPLFPSLHQEGRMQATFRQLQAQHERLGHTPFTDKTHYDHPPLDGSLVVITAGLKDCLARLLHPTRNYDHQLRRADEYHRARARWLETPPASPRLPERETYL